MPSDIPRDFLLALPARRALVRWRCFCMFNRTGNPILGGLLRFEGLPPSSAARKLALCGTPPQTQLRGKPQRSGRGQQTSMNNGEKSHYTFIDVTNQLSEGPGSVRLKRALPWASAGHPASSQARRSVPGRSRLHPHRPPCQEPCLWNIQSARAQMALWAAPDCQDDD